MGQALDYIVPIATAVLAPEIGLPMAAGGAFGSAAMNYSHTHNPFQALLAGGGSYLGSNIGGNLIGDKLGTVGSTLGDLGSRLPGQIASTGLGSAIGGMEGSSLGSQLGSSAFPNKPEMPQPFVPSQAGAMSMPGSLQSMSTLTPMQQASGLATQGVYGGGLGPQEQGYYNNLINRQLVDKSGQVSSLSSLNPIENSYLSREGLGGYNNSNSLLEALSKWKPTS